MSESVTINCSDLNQQKQAQLMLCSSNKSFYLFFKEYVPIKPFMTYSYSFEVGELISNQRVRIKNISKTYNDFCSLNRVLKQVYENEPGVDFDSLFPKPQFLRNNDPETIQNRIRGFQKYFNTILQLPGICDLDEVINFFN